MFDAVVGEPECAEERVPDQADQRYEVRVRPLGGHRGETFGALEMRKSPLRDSSGFEQGRSGGRLSEGDQSGAPQ